MLLFADGRKILEGRPESRAFIPYFLQDVRFVNGLMLFIMGWRLSMLRIAKAGVLIYLYPLFHEVPDFFGVVYAPEIGDMQVKAVCLFLCRCDCTAASGAFDFQVGYLEETLNGALQYVNILDIGECHGYFPDR